MLKLSRLATLTRTVLVFALLTGGSANADPEVPYVSISGPPLYVDIDYGQCTVLTWTATTNFTPISIVWELNGSVVGSGSTYSRSFCSYELQQISVEELEVKVTAGITPEAEVVDGAFTLVRKWPVCGDFICF